MHFNIIILHLITFNNSSVAGGALMLYCPWKLPFQNPIATSLPTLIVELLCISSFATYIRPVARKFCWFVLLKGPFDIVSRSYIVQSS